MNAVMNTSSTRTTQEWQAADSAHYLHPFTDFKSLAAKGSRIITKADNIYLWDSEGKKILDAMSGLWCVNAGHCRTQIVEAIRHTAGTLDFAPRDGSDGRGAGTGTEFRFTLPAAASASRARPRRPPPCWPWMAARSWATWSSR